MLKTKVCYNIIVDPP